MDQNDLLRAAPGSASPARLLLAALLGRRPATSEAPALLSPVDRLLGGELLAGKKTAIAVVGLAALAIFNPAVLAGGAAAGVAPEIIATLLKALGGLGLVAKADRAIQALTLIAARPQAPATADALRRLLAAAIARAPMPVPPPAPVPLPPPRPEVAAPARTIVVTGRMSTFGGPHDRGVAPDEGLALIGPEQLPQFAEYFLPAQPPNTTGLARRLDPDAAYIACRWNYRITPKAHLRAIKVEVSNPVTGRKEFAQPVDWGPHERTGRVADLSPGLARRLGLATDQTCTVVIPL